MKISTETCKKAIVEFVKNNNGYISNLFAGDKVDESLACKESNWKREIKRTCDFGTHVGKTVREFDCRPFDSQLRAYVYDDGKEIIALEILGE